jgi:voltage-gated potassium channel
MFLFNRKKTVLLECFIFIMIIYAFIYYCLGDTHFNVKQPNTLTTFIDYMYFSMTTVSTVGYGDITPASQITRVLVISQQFVFISMILYILPSY